MLASISAGIWAFIDGAPGYIVFLAFVSPTLIALGLIIAFQNYCSARNKPSSKISPLNIEFPDEWSCSEFVNVPTNLGKDLGARRRFWVIVRNTSSQNISNVRAELNSIKEWTVNGPQQLHPINSHKTFPLRFQDCKSVMDFSPGMTARLYLISHAQYYLPSYIRVDGGDHQVVHDNKAWQFTVTVTADGFMPAQRDFIASINGMRNGMLEMKAADS